MPPAKRRPRGQLEQLPSGSWRATVYVGKDPLTGKRRWLKETSPTYAEAKVELTRLQRQVDEELHPKASVTVGRAVEAWLEVADLEAITRERYDDLIRIYITPTFGEMPARSRRQPCTGPSPYFETKGLLTCHGDTEPR